MAEDSKLRIAIIDKDLCINEQGCNFICGGVCPVNRTGKDCIVLGEDNRPIISEDLCIACMICTKKCPVKCINIINLVHELKEPIHQYGINSFRLYRLPLPREGKVVGLIGGNALGKSTALRILAGKQIPNLGDYENEATMEKVIEFFRGKEMQSVFEGINSGELKVSFKPQNVDELPLIQKGKVGLLLKKVDERKKMDEVTESLNISSVLGHELGDLSGGELQRVAVAACILKDASVYALDEPSTYLDVSERLNMAKVLRTLADEGKSVIVIEHDLAVLDYLSDYVHILFGRKGAYGIISSLKTVKAGINEFLQGFISDENLRFREKELKFETKPPASEVKSKVMLEYPKLEKKFSSFSLSTEAGKLMESEVVGILGPNAIGKTTFVKLLAGIENPDNTELKWKHKVSYKPQYIIPDKGITVEELFDKHKIDKNLFKNEVDRRLKITELNEKQVDELSGGELQRVAVSLALCQECDFYLLDEPSAFIDVEDRLKVADAIRSVTNVTKRPALVVDHDILFQDYVSNRIIVFEGEQSKKGHALAPQSMHDGMNLFLKNLGISYRRDPATGRPRANKLDSVKDREQKEKGEYYYSL